MSTSKLMKVTYYDPKSQIRLLCYADTVVWDTKPTPTLTALRFGGYPERVQGLADAIYGGATIEIEDGKDTYSLKTLTRQYRRELSHDGVYAEATLIAEDDGQSAKQNAGDKDEPDKDKNDEDDDQIQQDLPPRNTYIFCTPGERRELFDAVDQKTAVPMIPEYQDYVLTELQKRNILRPLQVKSLSRKLEAWLLRCEEKDKNIVAVMEDGLKSGAISIPGATVGLNPLDEINSITEYLNTFGVTVAERIKKLFVPLFDPATESLSPEVLAINQYIEDHAGYGRGEKYSLELGGDINRAIASEFAMLAAPETLPLFLRKLQRKALKQYQRREPICKGSGDIICMLDESSSAESQAPWCKAVALALLDIAMRDQRRFAVIHFAGVGDVQTDLFLPGQYDREDVLRCAETFLNGNTDYETPLREALRLMEQEGFENADMVFVTDGECVLPDSFLEKLKAEQSARGFQITGILLDQEDAGFEFSLREFCTNVYRTSQLSRDQIAEQLVVSRVA